MDTAALDNQIAALRADDAVLQQRLADLDGKIAAWIGAVRDGQQALVERMRQPAPIAAPTEAVAPAPVEDVRTPEPACEPEPVAEPSAVEPPVIEAPVVEPEARAAEVAEPEAEAVVEEPADVAAPAEGEQHVPLFAGGKGRRAAKPKDAAPAKTMDGSLSADDEALLASLDDETANAVRVKRRLTGGRKSVRELLAEMGAVPLETDENSPDTDKSKRGKKWWRRGDG